MKKSLILLVMFVFTSKVFAEGGSDPVPRCFRERVDEVTANCIEEKIYKRYKPISLAFIETVNCRGTINYNFSIKYIDAQGIVREGIIPTNKDSHRSCFE